MVTVNIAYTQAINPAGATPVLTKPQLWKGLQRKVRRAQDFVPVITGSKVLEEHDNVVVREAYFGKKEDGETVPGQEGKTIREKCILFEPTKVCETTIKTTYLRTRLMGVVGTGRIPSAERCGYSKRHLRWSWDD